MKNPGVYRAFPGAIIGFFVGALIVVGLRYLTNTEPLWDGQVVLVLTPFTVIGGWLWGVGAFNPKWSEHGDHGHDDEHDEHAIVAADDSHHAEEEEFNPLGMLMSNVWIVTTSAVVIIAAFYFLFETVFRNSNPAVPENIFQSV